MTGIDAAWADVEALLPEGWRITCVDLDDAGVGTGWRAIASIDDFAIIWYQRFRRGRGETPVAALEDLARTLSKNPPSDHTTDQLDSAR